MNCPTLPPRKKPTVQRGPILVCKQTQRPAFKEGYEAIDYYKRYCSSFVIRSYSNCDACGLVHVVAAQAPALPTKKV